jgi:ABC-type Fe3+/spermidine/putrescine transport system ATPase subunit
MSAIEWRAVSKRYGARVALDSFSLAVSAGERVALFGPSGCGKTTALRLLAGFEAPDTGAVRIDGETMSENGRVLVAPEDRGLGMVFQDLALWPHLSVRGNLEFGLKARRVPAAERERRIRAVLALVRLSPELDLRPEQLSGGQQQRVALARALVGEPRVVLMDEPLSSLDPELRAVLRAEILRLHERLGFTLILVTHDREESAELASCVVSVGPSAKIAASPARATQRGGAQPNGVPT